MSRVMICDVRLYNVSNSFYTVLFINVSNNYVISLHVCNNQVHGRNKVMFF